GTITGNVTNSGMVTPGVSGGLSIQGNYTQTTTGSLVMNIAGTQSSQFGTLSVSGTVSLAGAFNIVMGYVPTVGDNFTVLGKSSGGSISGAFAGFAEGAVVNVGGYKYRVSYQGVNGHSVTLTVNNVPPQIITWASAEDYSRGFGEISLPMATDGSFVEPRSGGIDRLLVTFNEAINPASLTTTGVKIAGNDANGQTLDLSTFTITTSTRSGNTIGVIQFSQALPDYARYLIQITGVTDVAADAMIGANSVVMTALKGDVSGDMRVNSIDLARVRANITDPVDPASTAQVRADLSIDGRVNSIDLARVRTYQDRDARGIPIPVIPAVQLAAMSASAAVATDTPLTANRPVPMNLGVVATSALIPSLASRPIPGVSAVSLPVLPLPSLPLATPTSKVLPVKDLQVIARLPALQKQFMPPYPLPVMNFDVWNHLAVTGSNSQPTWFAKSALTGLIDGVESDIMARITRLHVERHS
ncbi:MAG: dockerin type I domain-containing protein, partial [Phycisphaerae bacterium]